MATPAPPPPDNNNTLADDVEIQKLRLSDNNNTLADDVRLLKMLGAGLCSRYNSHKSTLATTLDALPGASVPLSLLCIAESGAAKLARMVFNLSIIQWGVETIDKITSRELILLLQTAAENLEQKQASNLTDSDLSLVRHLNSFLKDVATTNGTFDADPDKARYLESLLSSPGSKRKEWLDKEDRLCAQLKMLSMEIQSVQAQLVKALSHSSTMERQLTLVQQEKHDLHEQVMLKTQELNDTTAHHTTEKDNLVASMDKEKTVVCSLELQLAASKVKCKELETQLEQANNNTKQVTESVGTLMAQLNQTTTQVRELASLKKQYTTASTTVIALNKEIEHGTRLNSNLMNELKKTEQQLIDVQSYIESEHGTKLKSTEYALAQARMELAQSQSENDDLMEEVEDLKKIINDENHHNTVGKGSRGTNGNSNEWKSTTVMKKPHHQTRGAQNEQHWG
tara:strand:- start:425 stop:1786 length:1362 start_codon:yes stop_codon:yes gene_type:complete